MRYLLDTNIALFLLTGRGISNDSFAIIEDYGNMLFLCAESIKEMASVYRKSPFLQKKWKTSASMIEYFCEKYGVTVLYPQREHYATFLGLKWNEAEHHHDPSDLIIIAHAITEHLTLISSDRKFHYYRSQGLSFIYNEP